VQPAADSGMVGLELEEGAKPPTAPAGGCQRVALDFTDLVSNRTSLHQGHRSGGFTCRPDRSC